VSTIRVNLIGRFGNQMFQYAWARAYAQQYGAYLITSRWIGEQIFDLPYHESSLLSDVPHTLPAEYHQDQASLIYTRKQVKEWFRFKPEVEKILSDNVGGFQVVCHLRRGDYKDLGYVVVSTKSYHDAIQELHLPDGGWTHFVSEENSYKIDGLPDFLPDFYLMMKKSTILLRANSSFSWWAATLGDAKVYSPVIEGLEGGREQLCRFVPGNHPRFANLPFVTDLHLPE